MTTREVGELRLLAVLTLPGVERSVRQLDDVTLVVDEFAGNCIRHTASGKGGQIHVALWAGDGVLRTEVSDDGAGGERPVLWDASGGESGRGLQIVDALASCWGHRPDGRRTTVWAEFPARVRL